MASTYQELARFPKGRAAPRIGASFAFGKPVRRRASITKAFVSFFELPHREHLEVRPALSLTLAKLLVWIVGGIAATSAGTVVLGAVLVRLWSGAFG
jgi:hypothetical protein